MSNKTMKLLRSLFAVALVFSYLSLSNFCLAEVFSDLGHHEHGVEEHHHSPLPDSRQHSDSDSKDSCCINNIAVLNGNLIELADLKPSISRLDLLYCKAITPLFFQSQPREGSDHHPPGIVSQEAFFSPVSLRAPPLI